MENETLIKRQPDQHNENRKEEKDTNVKRGVMLFLGWPEKL